jgi:hypothetical protein
MTATTQEELFSEQTKRLRKENEELRDFNWKVRRFLESLFEKLILMHRTLATLLWMAVAIYFWWVAEDKWTSYFVAGTGTFVFF